MTSSTDTSIDSALWDDVGDDSETTRKQAKSKPTAQAPSEMTESIEEESTKGGETKPKGDSMDMLDDMTASSMEEEVGGEGGGEDDSEIDMLADTSAFGGGTPEDSGSESESEDAPTETPGTGAGNALSLDGWTASRGWETPTPSSPAKRLQARRTRRQ